MLNVDYSLLVTVLYVIVLYLFLSRLFFRPVVEILNKRRALIEGRLEEARKRLEAVDRRTADYEHALRDARSDIYRQQETERERALAERSALILNAKAVAERTIQDGRARLQVEADTARERMSTEVDSLAKELTTAILKD